ncbi:hypothetical protein NKJ35_27190 [Mesorhizobium sp. M0136]|uniref:hypothetical protein n=1 Tax=Mesorhizobium sp. M0136 TaxID=2956890 RepID=UPI00333B9D95
MAIIIPFDQQNSSLVLKTEYPHGPDAQPKFSPFIPLISLGLGDDPISIGAHFSVGCRRR